MKNTPNLATFDAEMKCEQVLGHATKVMISLSGGADSDVMLDLIYRKQQEKQYPIELHYVFFNTGIEMQATLEHLDYLEKKYNIHIERVRAKVPVPLGCLKYGQPFISKFVSQMIGRLQDKNFDFKRDGNKSYEELIKIYPDASACLKWWTNSYPDLKNHPAMFNIARIKYLKEFMIENPPDFKISNLCCQGAKKDTSHIWEKDNPCDLKCMGLRKAEGGIRATSLKNCFTDNGEQKVYRPIFWFTDKDRKEYEDFFGIIHSKCYTEYGFKRTGCCGCPFNSKFEEDLQIVKQKEPLLYQAVNNIFGKSYEYTRKYREYKSRKKNGIIDGQTSLF